MYDSLLSEIPTEGEITHSDWKIAMQVAGKSADVRLFHNARRAGVFSTRIADDGTLFLSRNA